jgi:hypothetical protein
LLGEDLSETDHLCIVVELLRKVDHGVSCVLLIAGSSSEQERRH